MTVPTFILPAIKNNVTTPQLIGAIGAGDTSIALKAGHGASFPTILRGDCSSTGSGILLNDTGALGSVAVGDFIHNLTDGSSAVVTSISGAPDSIATTPLEGGSDNTWQSGDVWVIGMFIATIVQYDDDGVTVLKRERVKVTNRVTDTLTVVRGYDGDSAQTFLADDFVQLLIEKSMMENLQKAVRNLVQKANDQQNNHDSQATLITNLQKSAPMWLGSISGTNTITAAGTPAITAYASGLTVRLKVANSNSGAVTLNIDSVGAKKIKRFTANDGELDLSSGDLKQNGTITLVYDAAADSASGAWILQSPIANTVSSNPSIKSIRTSIGSEVGTSTTSETDTGGTYTIPANDAGVCDVYVIEISGKMRVNTTTCTLRIKLNSTELCAFTMSSGGTTGGGRFAQRIFITILTSGAGGTLICNGLHYGFASTETRVQEGSTLSASIDTTTTNVLKLTTQYGTNNGSNGTTVYQFMVYKYDA